METIKELTNQIVTFRDLRNWKQFHNPKDLAISLLLEASEVLEHFQWKSSDEINQHLKKNKIDVAKELADALYWVLLISHDLDIDVVKAFQIKMKENAKKYPVKKSKGNHTKYNKL